MREKNVTVKIHVWLAGVDTPETYQIAADSEVAAQMYPEAFAAILHHLGITVERMSFMIDLPHCRMTDLKYSPGLAPKVDEYFKSTEDLEKMSKELVKELYDTICGDNTAANDDIEADMSLELDERI